MRVAVIMNAGAGSIGAARAEERATEIRAAFDAAGVDCAIHAVAGARLAEAARAAAADGVDAVVAAGGDGTVSACAGALAGGEVPLAVLPLGTLNHFARDLGMPTALADAARAIATGTPEAVDVGEVNGRVFVNNSSIGLYPELVRLRDAEQRATGHGKWRAMVAAAWRVLRRFPLIAVHLTTDDATLKLRTPFVFVGNNPYRIDARALGQRERLDRGQLSLYSARCTSRLRMIWLSVRAIVQRLDAVDDFEAHDARSIRVVLPRRRVPVALDGEVVTLASPLHYRIRPGALVVIRPPAAAAAEDQAA